MTASDFITSGPEQIFRLRKLDPFMAGHKGFIAGGCFKNLFNGEPVKDVDVFFQNERDFWEAVEYMTEHAPGFQSVYTSKNVVAFRHEKTGIVAELVRSVYGSPSEVLSMFDFTVTKFAYYKARVETEGIIEGVEYKVLYHPQFFEHLHLRRLVIDDQIPKPMSTFERMLKYRQYGYTPCGDAKQKLIQALRALPEDDVRVPSNFYAGID